MQWKKTSSIDKGPPKKKASNSDFPDISMQKSSNDQIISKAQIDVTQSVCAKYSPYTTHLVGKKFKKLYRIQEKFKQYLNPK